MTNKVRRRGHRNNNRCETCRMLTVLCICERVAACRERIQIQTRIVILMHHREKHLTSNTARLAANTIPGCEIRMRGLKDKPFDPTGILEDHRQALLLYPSPSAQELGPEYLSQFTKPITLVVPDGSWRQAAKVARREPFLKDVPHVTLAFDGPSIYTLRREPKPHTLATFEAIARALGAIEGKEVRRELEAVFQHMVEQTMYSRKGIHSKSE